MCPQTLAFPSGLANRTDLILSGVGWGGRDSRTADTLQVVAAPPRVLHDTGRDVFVVGNYNANGEKSDQSPVQSAQ